MLASLGRGDRAADVGPFPKVMEEMRVEEDPGFSPWRCQPSPLRCLPSPLPACPLVALLSLRSSGCSENFEELTKLLTNLMGTLEEMKACVGELERKV